MGGENGGIWAPCINGKNGFKGTKNKMIFGL
jgi:hypothetical protein